MQVSVLASGSKGNAILVAMDGTRVLVDAGISATRIKKALAQENVEAENLDGILITHEHTDHVKGLDTLERWYHLPVYSRPATLAALSSRHLPEECLHAVQEDFRLGALAVRPFSIPHDAADPVGYRLEGTQTVVTCTDLGFVTSSVQEAIDDTDVLVLEANHDTTMLKEGDYPWPLKRRILGSHGHLANADAAWAIARLHHRPRRVFLAHLSEHNNRPELAKQTVETILSREGVEVPVTLTRQDRAVRLHDSITLF